MSFEYGVAVGDTDQRGEMRAGGIARDHDLHRWDAPLPAVSAQKADRRFQVVNLRRKSGLGGKPIINAGHRVSVLHQFSERHVVFGTGSPRSTMHPEDQGRTWFSTGNMEVEFQPLFSGPRILNIADDFPSIRLTGSAGNGQQQQANER